MWNESAPRRGSYAMARTEDVDEQEYLRGSVSEERTLADEPLDEQDLPLSPEELAFHDPLDEKSLATCTVESVPTSPSSPRWTEFAQRLQWWKPRPSMERDDDDMDKEETTLLNNNWSSRDRALHYAHYTVSWLIWPLPSYLHPFFLNTRPKSEPRRPTDYLDGMRGFASLFVFFDHYLVGLKDDIVNYSFGADGNYSVFQLPFIRTIYSGSAMVSIFFVISGYVLSARCIVAMRAGNQNKVHSALTSMTFRRILRLFVPSIASSAITLLAVFLGIVGPEHPRGWTVWRELHSYWTYLHEDLFRLWAWDISFKGWYAPQLWTIPLEYKCSMILFLVLLSTARCTVFWRMAIEASLMLYLFYVDRWDVATFIAGMFIAEINIMHDERKKSREAVTQDIEAPLNGPERRPHPMIRLFKQLPFWAVFFFGFYLTGYPGIDAQHTPGYSFVTHFWAGDWDYKFRFFISIAAILLVFATSFLTPAQWFFTTPLARYLGKISYALYLIHVLMNRTLRYFLWHTFWNILAYESEEGDDAKFEGGWFLGTMIYVPCVLWAADIFWRMVDIPAVKFAKWVEEKCFVPETK